MEAFPVSKMEAARRQLDAALVLYFDCRDGLAIHTLAAAAYELLRDLHGPGLIERSAAQYLDEETMAELRRYLRKPQNFFKHATKDPGEIFEFDPRVTDTLLLESIMKYLEVTGDLPVLFRAYEKWYGLHHPDVWKQWSDIHAMLQAAAEEFGGMPRAEFLKGFLATATDLGHGSGP